jgi:hypothetical protein
MHAVSILNYPPEVNMEKNEPTDSLSSRASDDKTTPIGAVVVPKRRGDFERNTPLTFRDL